MEMDRIGALRCPTSEDLAAFVDGRLSRQALTHMESHLADCDECRELVADTVVVSEQALPVQRWGVTRRQAIAGAGTMVALAASLMLLVRVQPDLLPFGERHSYDNLVAAVGHNRTVEGRLTGGFAYAPLKAATRSVREPRDENFALLAAKGQLQELALTAPTARNRHAAGLAHLVVGEHDAAVTALEAAVAAESRAAYHSDLAAAYLARGREVDSPEDFERARRAADRALALDPSLDEAYFNRALALDALGETREAEEAYRQALARDAQSPWNAEITMRLQKVRQP